MHAFLGSWNSIPGHQAAVAMHSNTAKHVDNDTRSSRLGGTSRPNVTSFTPLSDFSLAHGCGGGLFVLVCFRPRPRTTHPLGPWEHLRVSPSIAWERALPCCNVSDTTRVAASTIVGERKCMPKWIQIAHLTSADVARVVTRSTLRCPKLPDTSDTLNSLQQQSLSASLPHISFPSSIFFYLFS